MPMAWMKERMVLMWFYSYIRPLGKVKKSLYLIKHDTMKGHTGTDI
jgi:hypothetical protein